MQDKLLDNKDDEGDPPALVVTKTGADLAESDSSNSKLGDSYVCIMGVYNKEGFCDFDFVSMRSSLT